MTNQPARYTRTSEPYFSTTYQPELIQREEMNPMDLLDKKTVKNLFIDSRDRDRTNDIQGGAYTSNTVPYSFVIDLQKLGIDSYKNVITAELKGLTFPKIAGEDYVIIDIPEFSGGDIDSTNNGKQVFGIAYFDGYSTSLQPGMIKPIKGSDFIRKIKDFNPPKAIIDKLHIQFKTYGGNVVTQSQVANVENITMLLQFVVTERNLY